ncbi:hypothetical protein SR1949_34580 [Sphaerospermopsis reniformis]|uniref:Uncharacterized protein n=1 Tax=Sphaerospermopsis reniformis TaxID=531300 RepID=A0A480A824_9CYAN|nr:hypothetical protein SR1949_34580 [Sphaerospermopsis reniformis]
MKAKIRDTEIYFDIDGCGLIRHNSEYFMILY